MTDGTHPDELLGRYPDLLDDDERAEVEAHLEACARCRGEVARVGLVAEAAALLAGEERLLEPSEDLDARARSRMRAIATEVTQDRREASGWRWLWVALPTALAAGALVAFLVMPLLRPGQIEPGPTPPDWGVKGGDADVPADLELQLALIVDEGTVPLLGGEAVPAGSEILLGGVIPEGTQVFVLQERPLDRERVWSGVGDAATARGGPLLSGGEPVVLVVADLDTIALELWLGEDPAVPGARRVQRIELSVAPAE